MATTRLGAVVLLLVLAGCSSGQRGADRDPADPGAPTSSDPTAGTAVEPDRAACRSVATLRRAAELKGLLNAFPFRLRDAFVQLSEGSQDPVLAQRAAGWTEFARLSLRDGARDVDDRTWDDDQSLTPRTVGRYIAAVDEALDQPLVPEPVGEGCPGVEVLRVPPGLVGWDVDQWSETTRLPGLNRVTRGLVETLVEDAVRDDDSTVCTRRFRDPLAGSTATTSWSFGTAVTGVSLSCAFSDGDRRVGLVVSTDLEQVAERPRGRDLEIEQGTVKLLARNSLDISGTTVTGPAVVAFDPDEAAGFSLTIDRGSPEQLLPELVGFVARDLTG